MPLCLPPRTALPARAEGAAGADCERLRPDRHFRPHRPRHRGLQPQGRRAQALARDGGEPSAARHPLARSAGVADGGRGGEREIHPRRYDQVQDLIARACTPAAAANTCITITTVCPFCLPPLLLLLHLVAGRRRTWESGHNRTDTERERCTYSKVEALLSDWVKQKVAG